MGCAKAGSGWPATAILVCSPESSAQHAGQCPPPGPATGRAFFAEIFHWKISVRSSPPSGGHCPSGARVEWEKGRECRFDIVSSCAGWPGVGFVIVAGYGGVNPALRVLGGEGVAWVEPNVCWVGGGWWVGTHPMVAKVHSGPRSREPAAQTQAGLATDPHDQHLGFRTAKRPADRPGPLPPPACSAVGFPSRR